MGLVSAIDSKLVEIVLPVYDEERALAPKAHGGTKRCTLVVSGATSAAGSVIAPQNVAAIDAFGGPAGRVDDRQDEAAEAVQAACKPVAAVSGLYDCAGTAAAIAATSR
jgi:hypothetical protein